MARSCPGTMNRGKFSAGASFCAEASTLSAAPSGAEQTRVKNARNVPAAETFMVGYGENVADSVRRLRNSLGL